MEKGGVRMNGVKEKEQRLRRMQIELGRARLLARPWDSALPQPVNIIPPSDTDPDLEPSCDSRGSPGDTSYDDPNLRGDRDLDSGNILNLTGSEPDVILDRDLGSSLAAVSGRDPLACSLIPDFSRESPTDDVQVDLFPQSLNSSDQPSPTSPTNDVTTDVEEPKTCGSAEQAELRASLLNAFALQGLGSNPHTRSPTPPTLSPIREESLQSPASAAASEGSEAADWKDSGYGGVSAGQDSLSATSVTSPECEESSGGGGGLAWKEGPFDFGAAGKDGYRDNSYPQGTEVSGAGEFRSEISQESGGFDVVSQTSVDVIREFSEAPSRDATETGSGNGNPYAKRALTKGRNVGSRDVVDNEEWHNASLNLVQIPQQGSTQNSSEMDLLCLGSVTNGSGSAQQYPETSSDGSESLPQCGQSAACVQNRSHADADHRGHPSSAEEPQWAGRYENADTENVESSESWECELSQPGKSGLRVDNRSEDSPSVVNSHQPTNVLDASAFKTSRPISKRDAAREFGDTCGDFTRSYEQSEETKAYFSADIEKKPVSSVADHDFSGTPSSTTSGFDSTQSWGEVLAGMNFEPNTPVIEPTTNVGHKTSSHSFDESDPSRFQQFTSVDSGQSSAYGDVFDFRGSNKMDLIRPDFSFGPSVSFEGGGGSDTSLESFEKNESRCNSPALWVENNENGRPFGQRDDDAAAKHSDVHLTRDQSAIVCDNSNNTQEEEPCDDAQQSDSQSMVMREEPRVSSPEESENRSQFSSLEEGVTERTSTQSKHPLGSLNPFLPVSSKPNTSVSFTFASTITSHKSEHHRSSSDDEDDHSSGSSSGEKMYQMDSLHSILSPQEKKSEDLSREQDSKTAPFRVTEDSNIMNGQMCTNSSQQGGENAKEDGRSKHSVGAFESTPVEKDVSRSSKVSSNGLARPESEQSSERLIPSSEHIIVECKPSGPFENMLASDCMILKPQGKISIVDSKPSPQWEISTADSKPSGSASHDHERHKGSQETQAVAPPIPRPRATKKSTETVVCVSGSGTDSKAHSDVSASSEHSKGDTGKTTGDVSQTNSKDKNNDSVDGMRNVSVGRRESECRALYLNVPRDTVPVVTVTSSNDDADVDTVSTTTCKPIFTTLPPSPTLTPPISGFITTASSASSTISTTTTSTSTSQTTTPVTADAITHPTHHSSTVAESNSDESLPNSYETRPGYDKNPSALIRTATATAASSSQSSRDSVTPVSRTATDNEQVVLSPSYVSSNASDPHGSRSKAVAPPPGKKVLSTSLPRHGQVNSISHILNKWHAMETAATETPSPPPPKPAGSRFLSQFQASRQLSHSTPNLDRIGLDSPRLDSAGSNRTSRERLDGDEYNGNNKGSLARTVSPRDTHGSMADLSPRQQKEKGSAGGEAGRVSSPAKRTPDSSRGGRGRGDEYKMPLEKLNIVLITSDDDSGGSTSSGKTSSRASLMSPVTSSRRDHHHHQQQHHHNDNHHHHHHETQSSGGSSDAKETVAGLPSVHSLIAKFSHPDDAADSHARAAFGSSRKRWSSTPRLQGPSLTSPPPAKPPSSLSFLSSSQTSLTAGQRPVSPGRSSPRYQWAPSSSSWVLASTLSGDSRRRTVSSHGPPKVSFKSSTFISLSPSSPSPPPCDPASALPSESVSAPSTTVASTATTSATASSFSSSSSATATVPDSNNSHHPRPTTTTTTSTTTTTTTTASTHRGGHSVALLRLSRGLPAKRTTVTPSARHEEELRQDGVSLYKTREDKTFNETRYGGQQPSQTIDSTFSGTYQGHGLENGNVAREKRQSATMQQQWEDEPEEGVYENEPELRSDVARESDRNVGAELPSVGAAKSLRDKFLTGQVENRPVAKKEVAAPAVVEGGVFENQPQYNPDVVHYGEEVQTEALPEQGTTRNMAARFKQLEKQGSVPVPSGGKREITPDRTGKVEFVSEPRGYVEKYEPQVQAGVFESQPAQREDVVRSDQLPEEVLPERGAAKSIAQRFKQMSTETSASVPRAKREITPDYTSRVEYVSEPTGHVERYEGRPEAGVFESQPLDKEGVVKSDQLSEEILPERGTARNIAARFKEMEKTTKSPPSPSKYKEFTPPRENGVATSAGVFENTPRVAPDVVHSGEQSVDVMPERGTAKNIANRFRQLSSSESADKSPRAKKEFTPPPVAGAGVYENKPKQFVPDYNRPAESGILENNPEVRSDVARGDEPPPYEKELPERGCTRNLVSAWRQRETNSAKLSPEGSAKPKEFTPPREEPRVAQQRPAPRTPKSPMANMTEGSVHPTDLPGQYQPQAEPTVFESEPDRREDVVREDDTDWNAGMPRAETTKKMLAKFQHIQAEAAANESLARPTPQARKEVEDNNSCESTPEKVGRSKSMRVAVQLEKCGACQKTVYAMEKIEIEKHAYHKSCFRCSHCHCILTPKTFAINKNVMFCTNHYKQLFATKGNYDEGFGHDQHKKRWKSEPNLADDEQQSNSTETTQQ